MTKEERAELEWIACSERMPDFGEDVLVAHEGAVQIAMATHGGDKKTFHEWIIVDQHATAYGIVTHWMPLPALPKEVR